VRRSEEPLLPDADEQLEQDLSAVLGACRTPEGLYDDLHQSIDEGLADAPAGPNRPYLVVLGAAFSLATVAAVMLLLLAPWRQVDDGLQMRGDAPPELEFTMLSVTEDGDDPRWMHDGDEVTADRWLAFQLKATPEAEVVLLRLGESSEPEVFARTRAPSGAEPLIAVTLDTGYRLATLSGEQTFACAASNEPLEDAQLAALLAGANDAPVARLQYLTVEVVAP